MNHNMNKIFLSSILSASCLVASAQGIYNAGDIIQSDLIGSARYVGMGGALNALGADISLMSSNPAGTALYRKSDVGFTLSGVISGEAPQMGNDKTRMSFDQAGVLFAFQVDNSGSGLQYVNFGVNYKKNRNFFGNTFANIRNLNGVFSQTYQIADLAEANWQEMGADGNWGLLADISAENTSTCKPGIIDSNPVDGYFGVGSKDANYRRSVTGSNIEADVNVSFNSSDRFYYGLSIGIHNIDYRRNSYYEELQNDNFSYNFTNWYDMTGTGVDFKFGFICRPIDDSPFRFGLSVHTPTWYNLTDANGSILYASDADEKGEHLVGEGDSGDYDYKLRTPWKFNVALGHTIGTNIALGAEYEYTDYSTAVFTPVSRFKYDDSAYMKDLTGGLKETLKGQHTVKLGVEYKPIESVSVRLGYNYLTSAYKTSGFNKILFFEPFTDTDFTNWGGINRFAFGLGYRWNSGYIDLAYQYQTQKGDFYAFDDADLKPTEITNNRSVIMATLGFRF